jgi:hypothetical protein
MKIKVFHYFLLAVGRIKIRTNNYGSESGRPKNFPRSGTLVVGKQKLPYLILGVDHTYAPSVDQLRGQGLYLTRRGQDGLHGKVKLSLYLIFRRQALLTQRYVMCTYVPVY